MHESERTLAIDGRSLSTIGRRDLQQSKPASLNIASESESAPRSLTNFGTTAPLPSPTPCPLAPRDATGNAKSRRSLTIIRRFQLARHARHHLSIVFIVLFGLFGQLRALRAAVTEVALHSTAFIHAGRPTHTIDMPVSRGTPSCYLPPGSGGHRFGLMVLKLARPPVSVKSKLACA